MTKEQFHFDPDDLRYRQVNDSLGARLKRFVLTVLGIVVLAVVLNVLYSLFFDTPRERQIRKENELLQEQYEELSKRKRRVDTVMGEIERIDRDIYRVIFDTEPVGPEEYPASGMDTRYLLMANSEDLVYYTAGKTDSMMAHDRTTAEMYDRLMIRGSSKEDLLPNIPAIQPIDNPDLSLLASGFGHRIHPIYKIMKMHSGVDFSAPVGTPVKATGAGEVVEVIRSGRGLGNRILVDHGFGLETLYACMDEIHTRRGSKVERGELIGTVGESGLSVAPHLHYEVRLNGEAVNPINFFFLELDPKSYDELILTSMRSGQSFD